MVLSTLGRNWNKLIAGTSNRHEELRIAWVFFEMLSKTHNEVVNGSRIRVILEFPNLSPGAHRVLEHGLGSRQNTEAGPIPDGSAEAVLRR